MHRDVEHLRSWIGRRETRSDTVAAAPVAALAATLDRDDPSPQPGDVLPPLWHWLYCWPAARRSALGADGHPARGGFLPPVPLARRMWAGSRFEFPGRLRIGDAITRRSEIVDVSAKHGRSGALVFVRVRHEIGNPRGAAVIEEQDIVYRDVPQASQAAASAAKPAPTEHAWRREILPDPVLLFRYSALTFNGHRIHYDRSYATGVEGYPGLVVHGPLVATLLLDLLRRQLPGAEPAEFSFRALRPLYDAAPFYIYGMPRPGQTSVALWAQDAEGAVTAEAEAALKPV